MKSILVIDDDPAILDMLAAILEDEGYQVLTARHGRQALDRLQQARPDLILSDVMMPIMDGWELYRAIQAEPTYRHIPIVFLTAVTSQEKHARASTVKIISKPFDLDMLLSTIARLIEPAVGTGLAAGN